MYNALSDGGVIFQPTKPSMSPCSKRGKTGRVSSAEFANPKATRASAADARATIDSTRAGNTENDGVKANATRTDAPYFAGVHNGDAVWECPGDQVVHLGAMGARCAPAVVKHHYARLRQDRGRLYTSILKHLGEVVSEYQYAERVVVDYIHRVPDAEEALYIVELAKQMEKDLRHYTSAVTSCANNTFENSTAMECLNLRILKRRLDTISGRMKRQLKRFRALTRDLVDWTSGQAWFRAAKDRAFQLGALGARTFARMAKLAYKNWGKIWLAWVVYTGGTSALAEMAIGIVMKSTWNEVLLVALKAILYICCARPASGVIHYTLATILARLFMDTRESLKWWLADSTVLPSWLVQAALKRIKRMEESIDGRDVKTATMMLAMMYMPSIERALGWIASGTCEMFGHVAGVSTPIMGLVAGTSAMAAAAKIDFLGKRDWEDRSNVTSEELTAISDVQAFRVVLFRISRLLSVFTVGGREEWDVQYKSGLMRAEAPFTDSTTGQYATDDLVQTRFEEFRAEGARGNLSAPGVRGRRPDYGRRNLSRWVRNMAGDDQEAPVGKIKTQGVYLGAHNSMMGLVMRTVKGFDELSVPSQEIVQTLGDSVLHALDAPLRSLGLYATDAADAADAADATDAAGSTPAAALRMYILLGGILIMVLQDPADDEERQSIMQWVEVSRTATGKTDPDLPPVPGGVSFRGNHAR